jgi:hypothetical protein
MAVDEGFSGIGQREQVASPFEKRYPNIACWVGSHGWIELGRDGYHDSFVRALDEGGMIWEGGAHYGTLDEALRALEDALAEWIDQNA